MSNCISDGSKYKLCNNEKCKVCFNKSFASHEKSKYLVDKNINPRKISLGSVKKYLLAI